MKYFNSTVEVEPLVKDIFVISNQTPGGGVRETEKKRQS